MADHEHKVTIRPWRIEQNMVSRPCDHCGERIFVSLPSPPPGEGHKQYDERGRDRRRRP